MSQGKTRLKELENQLTLVDYYQTPKNQRIQRSRLKSVKRKKPTSPQVHDIASDSKKHIKDICEPDKENKSHVNFNIEMADPDKLKWTDAEAVGCESKELDSSIVKALELLLKPMRDIINKLRSEVQAEIWQSARLHEENSQLHLHVQTMEDKNIELRNRMCDLENKILESYVMVHGIPEGPWESEEDRHVKIFIAISDTLLGRTKEERLNIARTMLMRSSRHIGPYWSITVRPIDVEFIYKLDAEYLLYHKRYLGDRIFADKVYCKDTEENHKILCPYFAAACKMPQYQCKCKLEEDTLVLRGVTYTTDDLHWLPAELNGFNISSKSEKSVFGFFGHINPLSNFHHTPFLSDGNAFHSSEQLIQLKKAQHFKDEETAHRILMSKSSIECKSLAKNIKNYDHESWKAVAKKLCMDGITHKYMQNPLLQNMLLETGDKQIVECCYDTLWGTGIPLWDETCLNPVLWYNQGIMGEILENIRD